MEEFDKITLADIHREMEEFKSPSIFYASSEMAFLKLYYIVAMILLYMVEKEEVNG